MISSRYLLAIITRLSREFFSKPFYPLQIKVTMDFKFPKVK